jgi:hypothetical protein
MRRSDLTAGAAALGGHLLAAVTQGLGSLRPAAKPLHPSGELYAGRLVRHGSGSAGGDERTGVAWIDEPGEDETVVRLSRAVGLPDALPDVHGLALRVAMPDGPADVLFATTGSSRVARFLLTASRDPDARPMTTLLPYRTATGPLLLRVDHAGEATYSLSWARPWSTWRRFATLHLDERWDGDPRLSFDPVLHQPPGLDQYRAVLALREPAYRRARSTRRTAT